MNTFFGRWAVGALLFAVVAAICLGLVFLWAMAIEASGFVAFIGGLVFLAVAVGALFAMDDNF